MRLLSTRHNHNYDHDQPALGLVEVLIVLAIVATTMVAATQLSIQSLVKIKEDEITDFATGRMIQAMEIAKSPDDVQVTNALGRVTNFSGTYRVDRLDTEESVLFQQLEQIERSNNCSREDTYFIESPQIDEITSPVVCLQVLVNEQESEAGTLYEITTRVIFKLAAADEPVALEYTGFRRDPFIQVEIN